MRRNEENMPAVNVTVNNIEEEVLNEKRPVLVDFWATWCGPCKMLVPIIDGLAEELTEVKICKVNVDEQSELVQKFDVMTVPSLLLFKDGQLISTSVGMKPKAEILEMLKNL